MFMRTSAAFALLAARLVGARGSPDPAIVAENRSVDGAGWPAPDQDTDEPWRNGSGIGARCDHYLGGDLKPCGWQPEGQSCSPTFQSIVNNVAINLLTFSAMFAAFAVLHCFPTWSSVLSPLWAAASDDDDVESDARIGVDGRIMIRFCRVGLMFSALGALMGCALVPIYASSDGRQVADFGRYTISNLDSQEWKIWVVVASSYILTICFCALMFCEWRSYVAMRRDHFLARARGDLGLEAAQAQFSLMVERVPPVHQSDRGLQEAFERVFSSLHSAVLLPDTAHKYDKLLLNKGLCICCCCSCCRQSLEQGVERLMRLSSSTRRGMRLANAILVELRAPDGPTSTGFVTLTSVADQQIALQQVSLFHSRSLNEITFADYVLVPAPEAREVVWRNAGIPHSWVSWRCKLGDLVCFVGVLLWSVPLLAVRTFTSMNFINMYFPSAARSLKSVSFLYSIFLKEGYLSVVAIQGLLLLLPYMLDALSLSLEGRKLRTEIARKTLIRNLYFQLASLYFMVIGGVLSTDFVKLVTSMPFQCLAEKLGTSVPQVAVYFINFVMARAGLSLPLLLLRPYALFCGIKRMVSKTEYKEPVYCWIGYEATNLTIVLVVANMYAIIAPLITVLCMVYFALACCVYNYLFRHVYTPEFDCQGRFWEELFQGAMVGLFFGTFTVTGIVTLYARSLHAFYAMAVLLVIIILFGRQTCRFYGKRSKHMPFEDAIAVDRTVGPELVGQFDSSCYLDPIERLELVADAENQLGHCDSTDQSTDPSDGTSEDCECETSSQEEPLESGVEPGELQSI